MSSQKIMLSGLWLKKDSQGRMYMTGNFGLSGKLLVFKNTNKTKETQPDYFLYLAPHEAPKPSQEGTDDNPFEGL